MKNEYVSFVLFVCGSRLSHKTIFVQVNRSVGITKLLCGQAYGKVDEDRWCGRAGDRHGQGFACRVTYLKPLKTHVEEARVWPLAGHSQRGILLRGGDPAAGSRSLQ
jgi:hypothetical protein